MGEIKEIFAQLARICHQCEKILCLPKRYISKSKKLETHSSLASQIFCSVIPFPIPAALSDDIQSSILAHCITLLPIHTHISLQLLNKKTIIGCFLEQFWAHPLIKQCEKMIQFHQEIEEIANRIATDEKIDRREFILDIHGYSNFLEAYSPIEQKSRGILYTPNWLAELILQIVDKLCKSRENSSDYDPRYIQIYDPAAGMLIFERAWIKLLRTQLSPLKIAEWLTKFTFMTEIIPTTVFLGVFLIAEDLLSEKTTIEAHKSIFKSLGTFLQEQVRFCSALNPNHLDWLNNTILYPNTPLLICGNPPYAVSSQNRDPWITKLMRSYAVSEPNITRLYDDYVKFFRYGHWILEQRGDGILAFITNRKYLDGKIFYGMRKSLLAFFDDLYIIDLFGDQRNVKQDVGGDNVFGIQTGVAIGIFIKDTPNTQILKKNDTRLARVHYYPIRGTITEIQKDLRLLADQLLFKLIIPCSPQFLFIPMDNQPFNRDLWEKEMLPIQECFNESSRAMLSSRDRFMIHIDPSPLKTNLDLLNAQSYDRLRRNKRIGVKKDAILENPSIVKKFNFQQMYQSIVPLNYRPFDVRHGIFYVINFRCGKSIILDHLRENNVLTLLSPSFPLKLGSLENAQTIGINFVHSMQHPPFNHILVTRGIVDSGIFGYSTSKIAPLYYLGQLNFSQKYQNAIHRLDAHALPDQLLGYLYAIFNCQLLALRFEPFLLHDFPRLLLPLNTQFFQKMAALGIQLVRLHLRDWTKEDRIEIQHYLFDWNRQYHSINEAAFLLSKIRYKESDSQLILIGKINDRETSKQLELTINCQVIVWKFQIGSIPILAHWLRGRKFEYLERKWTESEWVQLAELLHILNMTIKIRKNFNDVFNQYYPI